MKQLTEIFAIIVAVLCLVLLPKTSRAQSCKTNKMKAKISLCAYTDEPREDPNNFLHLFGRTP